jgi:hypothetical protein
MSELSLRASSFQSDNSRKVLSSSYNNSSKKSLPPKPANGIDRYRRSILKAIKSRKHREELKVTPELASRVIREYLLPMFEADNRTTSAVLRANQFGTSPSTGCTLENDKSKPAMLLSERLKAELAKTRSELDYVKNQWRSAENQCEDINKQVEILKHELLDSSADLKLMQFQFAETQRSSRVAEINLGFLNSQLSEYKRGFSGVDIQKKEYTQELFKEKSVNDIRYLLVISL